MAVEKIKDSLLLTTTSSGQKEILVEINQRTNPAVQTALSALLSANSGAATRLVSLSELQAACQKESGGDQNNEDVITRDNLTNASNSEQKILTYFSIARKLGASDVHFIISAALFVVKMRIYGQLQIIDEDKPEIGLSLCATAILSMCDITEPSFFPRREQDARMAPQQMRKVGLFGARYSHRPTGDGLIAVMRLIPDDGGKVPSFKTLGFMDQQIRIIQRMLRRPEGKIVLSGPTGSGKSTTLRSACRLYLDENEGRHLLTIEDPLEGQIQGAVQTPIICDKSDDAEVKLAWTRAIASAMRLDPDAIMEGEMRDLVSIMATIYAAQTGHIVLTTLHTNSAMSIPERMITLGVNADLICDAQLLIGMISQRLVPTLCPKCRIPWSEKSASLSSDDREYLERYCSTDICRPENLYFRNPEGCPECNREVVINGKMRGVVGRGLTGRTVIAEVIEPNNHLFHILKTKGKVEARNYWIQQMKGISRVEHLLHRINAGLVDPLISNSIVPLDEDERLGIEDRSLTHA
ncbi:Flp pilus assembly complex ATPase component TadA [Salmonella enterica]|nr:Flp pilus assembly complex ATPase component TadA [Salmonella enterica]